MPIIRKALLLTALALLPTAAAHATVKTETGLTESAAGKSETYRLNVPSEKPVATTQIRLVVPAGLAITRFQVAPGFTRTVTKNADGLITEVVWRGRVAPDEYARIYFQAHNPDAAGELVWKVYQTYADGSVVAWDDADTQKAPASRTVVK